MPQESRKYMKIQYGTFIPIEALTVAIVSPFYGLVSAFSDGNHQASRLTVVSIYNYPEAFSDDCTPRFHSSDLVLPLEIRKIFYETPRFDIIDLLHLP